MDIMLQSATLYLPSPPFPFLIRKWKRRIFFFPFFFCYILLPLLQKLILMPARTVARTQYGAYSFRRFSRTFISLDLFRSERGCALSISNFFCSPSPTKTHYVTSNNVIAACLPWLVVDRSINDLLCTIVNNFGLSYIPWW